MQTLKSFVIFTLLLCQGAEAFCPHQCVCDDDSLEASCIKSNLEVMPMTLNPSIQKLILKYNNFHSVDASFNFYPDLEYVDLSSNQIVSIPDRAFSSQRKLVQLKIENNKISSLYEKTFSGLGRLEVLSLDHNLIDKLSRNVFKHLKSVKDLSLKQNRISEIHNQAFNGLNDLTILDLSDNLLEIVPTEAIKHLTNLAELNLKKNNIKILPDSSFSQMFKLSILDISGNKIERVHQKAFADLKTLNQLNLKDNELYQVPSHSFESFEKLEILNIGQNKFSAIEKEAFESLTRLRELYISGSSDLVEVGPDAFSKLSDLEKLVLSSNKQLRTIDPQAFGSSSVNLKSLDVSNNGLSSVSSSLLSWSSLSSVDMSGNPWKCDCDISFLQTVILSAVNKSDNNIRIVRCWNPPNLRDRDITSLDMDCSLVQSPTTDRESVTMNNTELVAIISSSAVVMSVILIVVIIKSRKKLVSCYNSTFHANNDLSSSGKVLQYSPYQQEPRYVSYQVVQTLHRPDTGTATLIVNPHPESLIRHENYFMTLDNHEKIHYLSDLESEYAGNSGNQAGQAHIQYQSIPTGAGQRHMYTRSRHHLTGGGAAVDSIYQRVDTDEPLSDN